MRIQVWNRPAEDLWGLRSDEAVGQHFLNLDIGLAVEQLRAEVRRAVSDGGDGFEVVMAAVNRFGRDVEVRVVGSALRRDGDVRGAILVMDVATPVDPALGLVPDGMSAAGNEVPGAVEPATPPAPGHLG
jgi:two-component system CheB/CheR fusion protein